MNRGGSWNNNANNCRSANRNRNNPGNRNNNLGFRAAPARVKAGRPQGTEPAAVPSPQPVVTGQSARERGPVLVAEEASAKAPGLVPDPIPHTAVKDGLAELMLIGGADAGGPATKLLCSPANEYIWRPF